MKFIGQVSHIFENTCVLSSNSGDTIWEFEKEYPISVTDVICGNIQVISSNPKTIHFLEPFFGFVSTSRKATIFFLSKVIGIEAVKLFDFLFEKYVDGKNFSSVFEYLCLTSSLFSLSKENSLLSEISFLSERDAKKLLRFWHSEINIRRFLLLHIPRENIRKWTKLPEIFRRAMKNPYSLVDLNDNFSSSLENFLGLTISEEEKSAARIARTIFSKINSGWMCVPTRNLLSTFPNLIQYIPYLKKDFDFVVEYGCWYSSYSKKVEETICKFIRSKISSKKKQIKNLVFPEIFDDIQRKAVTLGCTEPICSITGSAGTGKTTILISIAENLERNGYLPLIVSFTGKAVSRISQFFPLEKRNRVLTMHMAISKANLDSEVCMTREIPFSVVIIDECSMITTELLFEFCQTFSFRFDIVFVGDPNQLQPIGSCSFFEPILSFLPSLQLTTNYRLLSTESSILSNAENMIRYSSFVKNPSTEFVAPFSLTQGSNVYLYSGNVSNVLSIVSFLCQKNIPASRIAILCPYTKYLEEINNGCSEIWNSSNRSIRIFSKIYRIGDKVSMKENSYEFGIMNGNEGTIVDIANNGKSVKILFDEREFDFFVRGSKRDLRMALIEHSFALTIHKSQGSEWDFVILYIPSLFNEGNFLHVNMMYTAITRAKRGIWILGDIDCANSACVKQPSLMISNFSSRMKDLE
jgi:hypothetical protein